jgi:hypothetical protein
MKQILLIVILLLSVGLMYGQTPTPTQSQPSTEDIKQARENLKVLLADSGSTATPEKGKSMADVMDKGLDVLTGYVGTLEGVVSKFAPEVWRIMIKQQYAKAIAYPLYWGLLLIVILIFRQGAKTYCGVTKGQPIFTPLDEEKTGNSYSPYKLIYWLRLWFVGIIPTIVLIPITISFLYTLTEGVMIAINPEYYALKDIIQLLK